MRKWIQAIIIALVVIVGVSPVSTIPMERVVARSEAQPAANAETTPEETEAALPEETEEATAEPTEEPTPTPTVKPTPEPTPEPTLEPTPAPTLPANLPINVGTRDAEGQTTVKDIQQKLIDLNYLVGEADGAFGQKSLEATMAFQEANGIEEAYGTIDEETFYKLFSYEAVAGPEPTPTPMMTGASGEDVTLLQNKLAAWGFLTFQPDGSFGPGTLEGVKAFQQYMHDIDEEIIVRELPTLLGVGQTPEPTEAPTAIPTPSPEPAPLPTNEDGTTQEPTQVPEPTAEPTPPPFKPSGNVDDDMMAYIKEDIFTIYRSDVKNGDTNAEAKRVQRRLASLGYMYSNRVDGAFGAVSELALKYFQRKNGLNETGIADKMTQYVLFSEEATKSDYIVYPYYLVVDVSEQRVHVYEWTGSDYSNEVKTFVCSTGTTKTPTILGTFSADGRACDHWYYFKNSNCWAQYAFRIMGGYLFHSVLYSKADERTLHKTSVNNLGRRASHGCVRLAVKDAKWIFDNCPAGVTVTIQN